MKKSKLRMLAILKFQPEALTNHVRNILKRREAFLF